MCDAYIIITLISLSPKTNWARGMSEESIRIEPAVGGEKESIAESQIMEQLNAMLRDVQEVYRELIFLFKDLDEGNTRAVDKRYRRIRNLKNGIEEAGINLMEYVIRVSPTLMFKDVYVTIIQDLVRVAEHGEAAGYRNLLLSNKEFERLPDNLYALMDAVLRKLVDMTDVVSEMLGKVGTNHKQVRELYVKLIKAENAIDDLYRESGLEIIRKYSGDVGALILIKELFDKLEDAADLLKRVGTYIRYISLHK